MNILITSIGRRSYMIDYFKEALNNQGKVHAGNSIATYALQKADAYLLTPNIYDEKYIDTIIYYCINNDIKTVISLFDIDLPILAKNKEKFEENGIRLIVSDYDFVDICNDKWKTFLFLQKHGFLTPKSFLSTEKVKLAIFNKEINYPVIIKPRWGMGSIAIFQADNELELDVLYQKTLNEIKNSYLKFESNADIENSVIIQEKMNGKEWGLDIFNNLNGNYLTCVPKRKIAMRAGETDIAETVKNQQLIDFGKKLSSITQHIANLDIDFFMVDDQPYILEMNCRFGGQYPFSHLAGVHFPKVIVQMLRSEEIKFENLEFEEVKGFKDIAVKLM